MVEPLRHRQTKGAATDMPGLLPPRHIPTLPFPATQPSRRERLFLPHSRHFLETSRGVSMGWEALIRSPRHWSAEVRHYLTPAVP
jgi:hypothetical protein